MSAKAISARLRRWLTGEPEYPRIHDTVEVHTTPYGTQWVDPTDVRTPSDSSIREAILRAPFTNAARAEAAEWEREERAGIAVMSGLVEPDPATTETITISAKQPPTNIPVTEDVRLTIDQCGFGLWGEGHEYDCEGQSDADRVGRALRDYFASVSDEELRRDILAAQSPRMRLRMMGRYRMEHRLFWPRSSNERK